MASSGNKSIDIQATLDKILSLLKAKDDTSRFAGLSLLSSALNASEEFRGDASAIGQCWGAISTTFLKRLLNVRETDKISSDEVKSMVVLAVSVLYAFSMMLPPEELTKERITNLCEPVVGILPNVDAEIRSLALQALANISANSQGAIAIIDAKGFGLLVELSPSDDLVVQVIKLALIYSVDRFVDQDRRITDTQRRNEWDNAVTKLIDTFAGRDGTPAIELIADVLDATQLLHAPGWLSSATQLVKTSFLKAQKRASRQACTRVIHYFMQSMDARHCLFPSKSSASKFGSSKPFSYVFSTYLLIDIRSTIPSLMELLASPDYPTTALRLSRDLDIISSFLASLVTLPSWDDDEDIPSDDQPVLDLSPDLLLQLRKSLAETVSMLMEHLRDRWDAAVTGAAGLNASARPLADANTVSNSNEKLALTWESPVIPLMGDPIVIAGTRLMSQWLLDDDNELLRTEASGITDVLFQLYAASGTEFVHNADTQINTVPDYRPYILSGLEGILNTDAGIVAALEHDGWKVLSTDLAIAFKDMHIRTFGIIRALLLIIESVVVTQTKEAWLESVLPLSRSTPKPLEIKDAVIGSPTNDDIVDPYEAFAALGQLIIAMISKAPRKRRNSHRTDCSALRRKMQYALETEREKLNQDTVDDLREVIIGIDELVF